jgi:cysteine desulfurase
VIYLDNNSTTRPSAAVVQAVSAALTEWWHNPSSVHRPGQAARQQVELARRAIADFINAPPREIVFTSSGTEAIDMAIRGVLASRRPRTTPTSTPTSTPTPTPTPTPTSTPTPEPPAIVSTRIEHAAVRDLLEHLEKIGAAAVRWAPIDRRGIIDTDALPQLLQGAALASIQWVNNETGAIQPIDHIGAACRQHNVIFHCDGTQWVGKQPTDVAAHPFDILTFSPHKFHGPKGVGIFWARRSVRLAPILHGAQELGRRGGTENVPGILGAGIACREARDWLEDVAQRPRLAQLRDRFEQRILAAIPNAQVNGPPQPHLRLWNTTNIGFPRLEAEALLLMLSERALCASAGAACSSGSLDPSPVLLAMGCPPEVAHGSIRFSLSRHTTSQEVEQAADIVIDCVGRLRQSLAITA